MLMCPARWPSSIGEQQGKQRQHARLEHDLLLALTEGIVGHANDDPPQVVATAGAHQVLLHLCPMVFHERAADLDRRLEYLDMG
ncbi:hypothetical protein AO269_31160 [Pseudomonas putida]|nr:hypothetical protein AO269_31160 [Pseudomonas putida]